MVWNLEEAVAYYKKQGAPADQSAVTALLREVQVEHGGGIPGYLVREIAAALAVKESLLLAIIRRMPSLRLEDTHRLEICAGTNCGKHAALAALAEQMKSAKITVKFVPCMRHCGKGPNIRWDGKLYHQADAALLHSLAENQ